jgi:hypothetical protein
MPHRRHHHDPHVERKLISTVLFEELSFKEHAGPFAERCDGTAHTFFPEGKMGRGIECDVLKRLDMADLVHAFGPSVLTGHDVPAQIDGDRVFTVHAALLAERLTESPPLDRGIEIIDPLLEAKSVWILNQSLKDRPYEAVQLRGCEPPGPERRVTDIHNPFEPDVDVPFL